MEGRLTARSSGSIPSTLGRQIGVLPVGNPPPRARRPNPRYVIHAHQPPVKVKSVLCLIGLLINMYWMYNSIQFNKVRLRIISDHLKVLISVANKRNHVVDHVNAV